MRGAILCLNTQSSNPPLGGYDGNGELEARQGDERRNWTYFISGRELVTVATPTVAWDAAQLSRALSNLLSGSQQDYGDGAGPVPGGGASD